jgi:arabinofuranosyltransferase
MTSRVAGRFAVAAVVVAALVVAWWIRWGCDDAYISYVYARSVVYGDGLTWFGDHVEGYTNFLWVLWVAIGFAAGLDPLVTAWVGSLAALVAVLLVTYRLALLRTNSVTAALCAIGLCASSYTLLAYGTSGLETMLQTALLTAALYEVERIRRGVAVSTRRLCGLSVIVALALWTRLDSAVYLAVLGVSCLHHFISVRAPGRQYVAAVAPALVLVGGWLAWKLVYYGDLVPNTFHAKVDVSTTTLSAATKFVFAFLEAYALHVMLFAAAIFAIARKAFSARLPFAIVVVWTGYVIFVGGDFMEFRFFVPIMPALYIGIAETLATGDGHTWRRPEVRALALVVLHAVFSVRHAVTFRDSPDGFYDSVPRLGTFYGKVTDNDWSRIGTPIGDVLVDTGATLACNGAGAIPYFADLPTVDQLGLNDRWVARHGARPKIQYARPGHQRFATHAYLAERHVTFVIGSPVLVPRGLLTRTGRARGIIYWAERLLGPTPIEGDSIVAVAAPIDDADALLMWYLTPSPVVDERIRAAGWEIRELHRK